MKFHIIDVANITEEQAVLLKQMHMHPDDMDSEGPFVIIMSIRGRAEHMWCEVTDPNPLVPILYRQIIEAAKLEKQHIKEQAPYCLIPDAEAPDALEYLYLDEE